MATRGDIVAEARRWIGTPYLHQAHLRGVGTDCGGLVAGVAVAVGLVPARWWAETFEPSFGGYGRQPALDSLSRICDTFADRTDSRARPGDFLLMRFDGEPTHLAIVADYRHGGLSVIHALSRLGEVAEHRLAVGWARRVVRVYRYRGITE